MRREYKSKTRWALRVSALVAASGVISCGGSASETPFPQPPIESNLAARHEAARGNDTAPSEALGSSSEVATEASAAANSSDLPPSAPTVSPGAGAF
jgi:hypothetical protein